MAQDLKNRETLDGDDVIWSVEVPLPLSAVSYRYLLCTRLPSCTAGQNTTVIKKWETALNPRSFTPVAGNGILVHDDGAFGIIGGEPVSIDIGHLCGQTELQLRVSFSKESPIQLFDKNSRGPVDPEQCSIFVQPVWMSPQQVCSPTKPCLPVIIKRMHMSGSKPSCAEHPQHHNGERYCMNDILVFCIQTFDLQCLGFKINILMATESPSNGEASKPRLVASTCIVSSQLSELSRRRLLLPLVDEKQLPVGHVEVNYLIVCPWGQTLSLRESYCCYWNRQRQKTLHVGHRGMGSSMELSKNVAYITENSISSFRNAARRGADYIEFDVQLTQDKEVVIYHDFVFNTPVEKWCSGGDPLTLEVAICNFTFDKLSVIRVFDNLKPDGEPAQDKVTDMPFLESGSLPSTHSASSGDSETLSLPRPSRLSSRTSVTSLESLNLALPDGTAGRSPFFPKLEEVFKEVPASVGFNIEIKFPDPRWDPVSIAESYFDMNVFVDRILEVVFAHAGRRRIVFSCFDADVCTCLRLKQNLYPVVFLTMGNDTEYLTDDLRLRYLHTGVMYAKSQQLLGIAIFADQIIDNPQEIQGILDDGLVIVSWGEGNNNPRKVEIQQSIGIHAIIHDKISESGKTHNVFFEEHRSARVGPVSAPINLPKK